MQGEAEIRLDRIALDDAGLEPERLAGAIHDQLGERTGRVEVHAIARALDIDEIREEALRGMEAALVTTAERGFGSIVVNAASTERRRRFSVGHELLHFLNPHHRPTTGGDRFECSREDMRTHSAGSPSRHQTQELEANRFAVELLMPRRRLRPFLRDRIDLRSVLSLSDELDVSREAAARRYVELHDACLAVVFSRDGCVSYFDRAAGFPFLSVQRGQRLPELLPALPGRSYSAMQMIEVEDWLGRPRDVHLRAQCLHQQNGIATTLLWAEADRDADDDAIDSRSRRHGVL